MRAMNSYSISTITTKTFPPKAHNNTFSKGTQQYFLQRHTTILSPKAHNNTFLQRHTRILSSKGTLLIFARLSPLLTVAGRSCSRPGPAQLTSSIPYSLGEPVAFVTSEGDRGTKPQSLVWLQLCPLPLLRHHPRATVCYHQGLLETLHN